MTRLIFVFLFLSMLFDVSAQKTFSLLFKDPYDDLISCMIEDCNKNIIAVGVSKGSAYELGSLRAKIWKITSDADTLSKTITFNDTAASFVSIQQKPNGNYLIFGGMFIPPDFNTSGVFILELDQNFEIITQKLLSIPGFSNFSLQIARKFNEEYLLVGQVENNQVYKTFLMKLNKDYDTIGTRTYSYPASSDGYYMDAIFSPDSTQLWTFGNNLAYDPQQLDHIIIFDTAMNLIKVKSFPFYMNPITYDIEVTYEHNMTVRWFTDSTFLVGCNHYYEVNWELENDIGFSFLDTTMNKAPIHYIGEADTTDYAAFFVPNFDFRTTDSIFFAGTKRLIADFWPNKPSWILAGVLDKELEPYYTRYYGGDAFYRVTTMVSTSDGGFIIACSRYDHNIQNFENDAFFLKLNGDGLITGTKQPAICPRSVFTLFPNPAISFFNLDLIITAADMLLHDIDGRVIMKKHIIKGNTLIDCTKLKPGAYFVELCTPSGERYTKSLILK